MNFKFKNTMIKTLLTLGLGIAIGALFVFQVHNNKNWYPVEKAEVIPFQTSYAKNTELYSPKEFENELVLFELSENSRYCWRTVKLINGETLTGSFGTDFDDGDYFLRKEDTLFIPKENVLYYK